MMACKSLILRSPQSISTDPSALLDGYALPDWYPWRFRRRLALLRRPFLQLDETSDPTILCAPGLIGDALRSMVTWYHKGEIAKARTKRMEALQGRINDVQRKKFNRTVAERL